MPTPFIMPKFDMDQETATVVEWLKQEGDHVELDETVLTVETDKVAIDVPSPATGTLTRISASPGDVVPVTTVIAYILSEGESEQALPEVSEKTPEVRPQDKIREKVGDVEIAAIQDERAEGAKMPATPIAVRMAKDMGIDLSQVPAAQGKITKADVEKYIQEAPSPVGRVKIAATPAARRLANERGVDLSGIPGSGPFGRVQEADVHDFVKVPVPEFGKGERPADLVPLVGIRKTIAERMKASFQEAPHIALTVEVDMTWLEESRIRLNQIAAQRDELRISVTALLVHILGWALKRNPYINASLVEETIYLWKEINIGVATAIEDGLIVPIIRNADRKSIREINRELKDLSDRARKGTLVLEEVKNGTFTISNLGMFGIDQFRAVINPPESAILAVGRVVRKPVVIDETDQIVVRPMMLITLSADHRVIDGVLAANFLSDLVQAIEMPDILLY